MVRYADHIIGRRNIAADVEAKLKAKFPPLYQDSTLPIVPGMVVDKFGKVLVWYLPGILQPARQVNLFCSLFAHANVLVGISLREPEVIGEGVADAQERVKLEEFPRTV